MTIANHLNLLHHVCRYARRVLTVSNGLDGTSANRRESRRSGSVRPISTSQDCLHRLHRCFQSNLFVLGTSEQIKSTCEVRMSFSPTGMTMECRSVAVFSRHRATRGASLTRVSRVDYLSRCLADQRSLKCAISESLAALTPREIKILDYKGVLWILGNQLVRNFPGSCLDLTSQLPL